MLVTVSEQAIRDLVVEAFDNQVIGDLVLFDDGPVNVNPVVDPSACETDLEYGDMSVPQTRQELGTVVQHMVRNVSNKDVPDIYTKVKDALVTGAKGKKMKNNQERLQVDEKVVRHIVNAVLSEIAPKFDPNAYSGIELGEPNDEEDSEEDEDRQKRTYKSTAIGGMMDVGGSTFEEIASELGFSVAGAKQAVDKALDKARFLASIDPDEREIIVLNAMNDYIDVLNKTGELSQADVQLMKDHPDIVRTLDGFREFLHNVVRKARKEQTTPEE